MKVVLLLLACGWLTSALAQKAKVDLTTVTGSPERRAVLQAVRERLAPSLRLQPSFVVDHLQLQQGFAFFQGRARTADGKRIDFRKTAYKEDVEQGVFDGEGTTALLQKKGGRWRVLAWVIGPTDVAWGCWWKTFRAPRAIFNYSESDCRWEKEKTDL